VTEAVTVEEEDTATILYTSGTTGHPKGAMLTHFSTAHSVIHYTWVMELTEHDRSIIAVPMSHVTGLIALVETMVHCGGALVIMPAFKAADFIDLAARHRMTYTLIVPAMFNLCLLAPNFEGADLSAWRVSGYGGAIMPEVTLERIAEKLPRLKLINCYGSTETTSPAIFMPPEEAVARKEYVGLTVPCGHIAIMDTAGVEVPHGSPGELCIAGAMVVPGYFNNREATGREFKAGYWKSGDLGIMDDKGYLQIIDRIKDVINRGGYKIFASEVEKHPA
jgi:long-chain acyl-CoA synthetase